MKSTKKFLKVVEIVCSIICSEGYCWRSKKRQEDFSRVRKMSFTDYIFAIIRGTKTSLQAGLNAFFDTQKKNKIEYSKQAFSKGRQRIKPEAFLELFQATVDAFYKEGDSLCWRGYHLLGIDGTKLNLPCTSELNELYGAQTSHGAPQVQALVSCLYDLLNGVIVDVRFTGCKSSERDAAQDMIASFPAQTISNPVFIMDRGYPSAVLIDTIIQSGHKFVMRCPTEFLRSMELPLADNTFEYKFAKLNHPLQIRAVKVQISSNTTEYLVTNLFESDISLKDFKQLYASRWGIESKYNDIKNKLEIENFTGYSPDAVLQDFYATLFLSNLVAALEFDLRDEIKAAHSNPENKYTYKMNVSLAISELKRSVIEMIAAPSLIRRKHLFRQIRKRLIKAVVPVRPDRSFPRERKHKAAKFPQNKKHV